MTAVDWTQFPEPWRGVGDDFARKIPALCDDRTRPPPPRLLLAGSIRRLREELGITQRELARRAGCPPHRIGCYERGLYRPSKAARERLAAILLPEPAREVAAGQN